MEWDEAGQCWQSWVVTQCYWLIAQPRLTTARLITPTVTAADTSEGDRCFGTDMLSLMSQRYVLLWRGTYNNHLTCTCTTPLHIRNKHNICHHVKIIFHTVLPIKMILYKACWVTQFRRTDDSGEQTSTMSQLGCFKALGLSLARANPHLPQAHTKISGCMLPSMLDQHTYPQSLVQLRRGTA